VLSADSEKKIEDLLVAGGLLKQEQLGEARTEAAKKPVPLLSYLAEQSLVSEEDLTRISAQAMGVPYANLTKINVTDDIAKMLPRDVAEDYMAAPFGVQGTKLAVGMLDPTNLQAVDFLTRKLGRSLSTYMVSQSSVQRIIEQLRSDVAAELNEAVTPTTGAAKVSGSETAAASARSLQNLVQDAPITKALNAILDYAAQSRASDIHIEPREKELKIRYRVDGILRETMTLPKSIEPALISRIKILSNLRIDEHRVPQDGQFQIQVGGQEVDLRIAIAPVVWGEQVVIRLLEKDAGMLTLSALGFRGRSFRLISEGIRRPHGMTLATGPTGSGKSTTLYAIVQEIKDSSINIVTLEDPVEYKMDGINQIQVNPDVGLTFASGLRSILRQDPNVVLVGEIRDKETADLAVQAALTGHVVLSTLHTNNAAGVLPRLLDMDIEPFLITSTVNTVIGQRLVRQLCDKCKEPFETSEVETKSVHDVLTGILPDSEEALARAKDDLGYDGIPLLGSAKFKLWKAVGCADCIGGYKGRIGIQEVFVMSPAMEKLLAQHATTSEVQQRAQDDGMITMKQDGYLKALNGITTLEEVARVAADY